MDVTSYQKCKLFGYLAMASVLSERLTQNTNFIMTSFGITEELSNTNFQGT